MTKRLDMSKYYTDENGEVYSKWTTSDKSLHCDICESDTTEAFVRNKDRYTVCANCSVLDQADLSTAKASFENRWVVIAEGFMPAQYKELKERLFFAQSGFGCTYGLHGQKVYGYHVDGFSTQYQRPCIERFATEQEIAQLTEWTETTKMKLGDTVRVLVDKDKPAVDATVDEINRAWCVLKIPSDYVDENHPDAEWHQFMTVKISDITGEVENGMVKDTKAGD